MADTIDKSEHDYQIILEAAIASARSIDTHLPGDFHCLRCGEANDRRNEGYSVCFSCLEEIEGRPRSGA